MARGFDWSRAKPRRPTLCIADEKEPEPYRRPDVRRVRPKLSKAEWRSAGADAVKEFEARKAIEKAAPPNQEVRPPWE